MHLVSLTQYNSVRPLTDLRSLLSKVMDNDSFSLIDLTLDSPRIAVGPHPSFFIKRIGAPAGDVDS
jgi:hypothetical protein